MDLKRTGRGDSLKSIAEKRKYIMKEICKMYDGLDPSGTNSKLFKDKYGKLSDKEFEKQMNEFFNDPERKGFYLEIEEFERDLNIQNVFKTAEELEIPLFEYVALPHINGSAEEDVVVTPEKVPVGFIHGKRLQQTALKKNTGSIHTDSRSAISGLVTGDDKNAVNSNVETYALTATNSRYAIKELLGPRADSMTAKNEMYANIQRDGYCSLEDLTQTQDKPTLNSIEAYFELMMLQTNLVNPDGVL